MLMSSKNYSDQACRRSEVDHISWMLISPMYMIERKRHKASVGETLGNVFIEAVCDSEPGPQKPGDSHVDIVSCFQVASGNVVVFRDASLSERVIASLESIIAEFSDFFHKIQSLWKKLVIRPCSRS